MPLGNKALSKSVPERVFMDPVETTFREPVGDLWEIGKTKPLLGKWYHYYEIYEELLSKFRGKPVKVLEIGVYYGDSLRLWKEYLGPDSVVVGLDIIKDCMESDDPDNGVHVRLGDQANHDDLQKVVEEFGPFDVIIDDGCHETMHQYMSFVYLFRNGLKDDGLYIVEDMHSNLWKRYITSNVSFLSTCRQLTELMYGSYSESDQPQDYYRGRSFAENRTMEYYEAWVYSVQFFDSIVAIRRKLRPAPVNPELTPDGPDIQDGEKVEEKCRQQST